MQVHILLHGGMRQGACWAVNVCQKTCTGLMYPCPVFSAGLGQSGAWVRQFRAGGQGGGPRGLQQQRAGQPLP